MSASTDEKSANTLLSAVLNGRLRSLAAQPERSGVLVSAGKRPDIVTAHPNHERILIENKYDDKPDADHEQQCLERLKEEWAADGVRPQEPVRLVVGVRTPSVVAGSPTPADEIEATTDFGFALFSQNKLEGGRPVERFPAEGWLSGNIRDLAAFLYRAGSLAIDDKQQTEAVWDAIRKAGSYLSPPDDKTMAEMLLQETSEQSSQMVGAILFNAAVFQQAIASHHPAVPSPSQMLDRDDVSKSSVLASWREVLKINYHPIFAISEQLLDAARNTQPIREALRVLFAAAVKLTEEGGTQGIVGKIFGELVSDRKFLAAFYTQPSAAALVAELALAQLDETDLAPDWSNPADIANLRVADFACGTGALLTATYRQIVERHALAGGNAADIHRHLLEQTLIGCDIMPSAVHLTLARLSAERPEIDYKHTQIWAMLWGVDESRSAGGERVRLGSLDLLSKENIEVALWGERETKLSGSSSSSEDLSVRKETCDVVIMNPPFTRLTINEGKAKGTANAAFSSLGITPAEAKKMADELSVRVKKNSAEHQAANGSAGFGTHFTDLAHEKLKQGGVLAIVLPLTALSGSDWTGLRGLLAAEYDHIKIFTISGSEREGGLSDKRAFSADTGMAECVIVATKRKQDNPNPVSDVCEASWVGLAQLPVNEVAGIQIANETPRQTPKQNGYLEIGERRAGSTSGYLFRTINLGNPAGVANSNVMSAAMALSKGNLELPQVSGSIQIPIAIWEDLAIANKKVYGNDGFTNRVLPQRTEGKELNYPSIADHNHDYETQLRVLVDAELMPINNSARTRSWVMESWNGVKQNDIDAGTLIGGFAKPYGGASWFHINENWQTNSQPLAACLSSVRALAAGRAWQSVQFHRDRTKSYDYRQPSPLAKAAVVWLNSTLGMLMRWWISSRQQVGRSWATRTDIAAMMCLDVANLPASQLTSLAAVCDRFADQPLLPANEAYRDDTRQALDEAVLCEGLGLPTSTLMGLAVLRQQWCEEPSVHGGKSTKPEK